MSEYNVKSVRKVVNWTHAVYQIKIKNLCSMILLMLLKVFHLNTWTSNLLRFDPALYNTDAHDVCLL